MPEPAPSALDDARKRARRRLVGAIVLALAAAVIVPIFLESDPKPLGSDVQIQIPAVDDAKFQNRLTPQGKGTPPDKGPATAAPKSNGATTELAAAPEAIAAKPPPPPEAPVAKAGAD